MNYINTPISYREGQGGNILVRDIETQIEMIDRLIELIVFTPKGSFNADPDFGFEYWNHEYSNMHYRDFDNEHTRTAAGGLYNEITKKECQESICKSLARYEPHLKQIEVSIELNSVDTERSGRQRIASKYKVAIVVSGILDNGLGTVVPYEKSVSFLMEPTVKQFKNSF